MNPPDQPTSDEIDDASTETIEQASPIDKPVPAPINEIAARGNEAEIRSAIASRVTDLLNIAVDAFKDYVLLSLYDPDSSIAGFETDRIYDALHERREDRGKKNVALFLVSPGGEVEPAYHISRLCKDFAREKFVVLVPRRAKSAATLVAIGADQVHMGPLGELGPIDPQLGGLPALGVVQALNTVASVAERYPGSSTMLANYLSRKLDIEQIGYCERITESAAQYAERLLRRKGVFSDDQVKEISHKLVYEYKDHSMVIDLDEAQNLLGTENVRGSSLELAFATALYRVLNIWSFWLDAHQKKALEIVGAVDNPNSIFIYDSPRRS
jgi:hypothetical protein